MERTAKVIRADHYTWNSIERKEYKDDTSCYKGVHRYTLLGEKEDEQQLNFQTRYFEVENGGYTSFEYHRHPHSVIIIRGRGTVILGDELHDISLHDVIYIPPNTMHQFHADRDEPLGFICIVDRYRDRPTLPDKKDIRNTITSEKVLAKIRR